MDQRSHVALRGKAEIGKVEIKKAGYLGWHAENGRVPGFGLNGFWPGAWRLRQTNG